jgi:PAS domain S-box-containing protein
MPAKAFQTRYESEVRISLLLLVLFLFLMNFVSLFLFYNTQTFLKSESKEKLSTLGLAVQNAVVSLPSGEPLSASLRELSLIDQIRQIEVYRENGTLHASSHPGLLLDTLAQEVRSLSGSREKPRSPFLSQIRTSALNRPELDFYFPFSSADPPENYWAVIKVDAQSMVTLQKTTRIISWMMTLGFVAALVVTMFMVRATLRPYQKMKQEALQAKLVGDIVVENETDLMVETFKKTITELKEKERILQDLYQASSRKAQDLSRLNEYILSGMQSGVIICNPNGEINRVNFSALKILGAKEAELVGKKLFDFFGEESQLTRLVQKALLERGTCLGQEVEIGSGGVNSLNLEVNTSLIEDEQGQLLGVTVLFMDVSQLRYLRQELLAKEKMASLGEITAGLAHQLRNSMGAIYGFANLLRKSIGEPNQLGRIVEDIGRETKSLETLVERFLNFSKPLQLHRQKLDLPQLISETYQASIEHRQLPSITFELNTQEMLPMLFADQLLLKQTLQNIIQNALEAMPQGGRLQIWVSKAEWGGEKHGILVTVSDSGTGMTQEELHKIFEPFYSTKSTGTGLGLSVAKKIIHEHGGKIEVESKKDHGSAFRIYLPVQTQPEIMEPQIL